MALACAATVCLALLTPSPAAAATRAARVRWQPTGDPLVAGYHVYVRRVPEAYNAPLDAGMGTANADGSMLFVVPDLDANSDYAFALTAYRADGSESEFSNELMLPVGPAGCADGRLTVSRFAYRLGRRKRLVAQAAFAAAVFVDPTIGGATVELGDAGGRLLYSASVPGTAFRRSRHARTFRYVTRGRGAKGAGGLRRLVFKVNATTADVSLVAKVADLPQRKDRPLLTWRVRLGGRCVEDQGLACGAGAGRVVSCL